MGNKIETISCLLLELCELPLACLRACRVSLEVVVREKVEETCSIQLNSIIVRKVDGVYSLRYHHSPTPS